MKVRLSSDRSLRSAIQTPWRLMEIPRRRRRMNDRDFFHARGLHVDDIINILQRPFEEKKFSLNDRGAILLENIRRDDDVRDTGLIFQAEEDETFCSPGAL